MSIKDGYVHVPNGPDSTVSSSAHHRRWCRQRRMRGRGWKAWRRRWAAAVHVLRSAAGCASQTRTSTCTSGSRCWRACQSSPLIRGQTSGAGNRHVASLARLAVPADSSAGSQATSRRVLLAARCFNRGCHSACLRVICLNHCRYSALEVLFDTLSYHGSAFTPEFWTRIFDSVLLSIFDHVRAEVLMPYRSKQCSLGSPVSRWARTLHR
jgi:hypothetical protein